MSKKYTCMIDEVGNYVICDMTEDAPVMSPNEVIKRLTNSRADKEALVRYITAVEETRTTAWEYTMRAQDAWNALPQELRDKIEDPEAHEKIQEAM